MGVRRRTCVAAIVAGSALSMTTGQAARGPVAPAAGVPEVPSLQPPVQVPKVPVPEVRVPVPVPEVRSPAPRGARRAARRPGAHRPGANLPRTRPGGATRPGRVRPCAGGPGRRRGAPAGVGAGAAAAAIEAGPRLDDRPPWATQHPPAARPAHEARARAACNRRRALGVFLRGHAPAAPRPRAPGGPGEQPADLGRGNRPRTGHQPPRRAPRPARRGAIAPPGQPLGRVRDGPRRRGCRRRDPPRSSPWPPPRRCARWPKPRTSRSHGSRASARTWSGTRRARRVGPARGGRGRAAPGPGAGDRRRGGRLLAGCAAVAADRAGRRRAPPGAAQTAAQRWRPGPPRPHCPARARTAVAGPPARPGSGGPRNPPPRRSTDPPPAEATPRAEPRARRVAGVAASGLASVAIGLLVRARRRR